MKKFAEKYNISAIIAIVTLAVMIAAGIVQFACLCKEYGMFAMFGSTDAAVIMKHMYAAYPVYRTCFYVQLLMAVPFVISSLNIKKS